MMLLFAGMTAILVTFGSVSSDAGGLAEFTATELFVMEAEGVITTDEIVAELNRRANPTKVLQPLGATVAVALVGTGEAFTAMVPDIDGDGVDDEGTCFTIDLIDLNSNEVIGDATDCLSNITEDGDGLRLVGTTTFNFPQGQLVTRGLTTVQPLLHGENGFTHATAAPPPLNGESNILSGTGAFEDSVGSGTARLSGLVDMSRLGTEGLLTFDCLFVIDL